MVIQINKWKIIKEEKEDDEEEKEENVQKGNGADDNILLEMLTDRSLYTLI